MRHFLKIILILVLLPVVTLSFLILYATLSDYRPPASEVLYRATGTVDTLPDSEEFNLLTWNIGYGGLDGHMDFFYDGGRKVRTPENQFHQNIDSMGRFLSETSSLDFALFQEVDKAGKRSYHTNEVDRLDGLWKGYTASFAKNYDVFFVPVPFDNPMGSVHSGLLSISRYIPLEVSRISIPGQYGWPKRLFMLDRCIMVMRYPLQNGKQLLVINTHNEAYDNGSIRDQQMDFLRNFLLDEYGKGNSVVVAGDWNQCPPSFKPRFAGEIFDTLNYMGIEPGFLPRGWDWVYDNTIPSNRRLDMAYIRGKTRTTVIDFFLLSPNLRSNGCCATDLAFAWSDHHPVRLKFTFR